MSQYSRDSLSVEHGLFVKAMSAISSMLVVFLSVLFSNNTVAKELHQSLAYPEADYFLAEQYFANEKQYADEISELIRASLEDEYSQSPIKRDAHPKAHGCVKAVFAVHDNIPMLLRQGLFSQPNSFPAIIRYSNGSSDAKRADAKGDTRGMSIKLLDVPGEKLMDIPAEKHTQDFLLMSAPAFFVNDPKDYAKFFRYINSSNKLKLLLIPFVLGWQGSINAFNMLRGTIDNPLTTRYWSVVPYQLGEADSRIAVKYSVKSCHSLSTEGNKDDPNFLRQAMKDSLNSQSVCLKFMVQHQPVLPVDPSQAAKESAVENVVEEWSEEHFPFYPVATITIDSQDFDTTEQNEQCEAMSYNPWHSVAAHKPLGSVNRIRKSVYDQIAHLRRASSIK